MHRARLADDKRGANRRLPPRAVNRRNKAKRDAGVKRAPKARRAEEATRPSQEGTRRIDRSVRFRRTSRLGSFSGSRPAARFVASCPRDPPTPILPFGKTEGVLFLCMCSSPNRLAGVVRRMVSTGARRRNLQEDEISFFRLQAFDFPQNGRRNLWKCLEKKAANLEMFGSGLQRLGGPRGPAKETARPVEPMPFEIAMEPPTALRQPRERGGEWIGAG